MPPTLLMAVATHRWRMGPGFGRSPLGTDLMVRATYVLAGAATGAPRTVTYWRLRDRLRAEDVSGLLWLEGPLGGEVVARSPDGALVRIDPGGLLPKVPAPELDALGGVEQAAAWVDV